MSTAVGAVRRLVAVALTDADALLPGSDLRHVADAATEVDVLVARNDPPGPAPGTSPMDAEDYPDDDLDIEGHEVGGGGGAAVAVPLGSGAHGASAGEIPEWPRLHRLGLRWTVQDRDEPDLVAAMCELVGFDPDDRVSLLAPAAGPDPVSDPEVTVALRAVRRVARVYGLPVLQYRRLGAAAGAGPVPDAGLPASPIACGS